MALEGGELLLVDGKIVGAVGVSGGSAAPGRRAWLARWRGGSAIASPTSVSPANAGAQISKHLG
jgi:hypothetical protein